MKGGKGSKGAKWGRDSKPSLFTVIMSATIMILCPLLVFIVFHSIHHQNGSLWRTLQLIWQYKNFTFLIPPPTLSGFLIFAAWLLIQAIIYIYMPAPIAQGQETPAGLILNYKVNGLKAWLLSNGVFLIFGLIFDKLTLIADNWGALLIAANCYGFALALFAFLKAHLSPSHLADCKYSGSWLYDLFMGIEFNPRFGDLFDFKLFHNGRPGIVAWTMINMSFAALQWKRNGSVSDSMILVNILQAIYVIDFFVHEDWYLKTMDIAHDHFGFYLSWGDSVWLPYMYTLQAQYLAYNPIHLGTALFWIILLLGLAGYCIFREANFQKDLCRRTNGNCMIWGSHAKVIRPTYTSVNGTIHSSVLLCSGFWGLARHCNYAGDLLLSFMMCLATGAHHLLPYFYIIFMSILLIHRVERDNQRCLGKYGSYWREYCKLVPAKLIPGIY